MNEVKLLDYGYIRLVETWGSDERIIEAARMSTDKGFQGWGDSDKPGDEKLLRYLWENKHSTPFEMAGAIVEVQAPIFVFREWHRHRTQCLAGDTQITLATDTDRGVTYKRTIREIFQLKHGGVVDAAPMKHRNGFSKAGTPVYRDARRKNAWRTRMLPNCQTRVLRVLDEGTNTFKTARMADVWESGVKELFLLEAGSRSVRASAEHPFFTKRGWVKMKDIEIGDEVARLGVVASHDCPIPPILRQGIGVWTSMMRLRLVEDGSRCYLYGQQFVADNLELDHVIPVHESLLTALDVDNLRTACVPCHRVKTNSEQPSREGKTRRGVRWERVKRLPCSVGEEMTYDIEVEGPHHNYVANDLVVHNSYNELSARYTPLPDLNYIPTVDRLMLNANGTNKQAGTIARAQPLTAANAERYRDALVDKYRNDQALYEQALADGIPKELARVHLPVARYSRMRASAVLSNWFKFLSLRMAPNAQYEIRVYANALFDLLSPVFPRSCGLFGGAK